MVKKQKKLKLVDPECKREVGPITKRRSNPYNCAPVDLEIQEVPKKMMDFIDLKNNPQTHKIRKRKKKRQNDYLVVHKTFAGEEMSGMSKPLHNIPEKMAQRENESVSHFVGRIQDLANKYNSEAKIEDKFDIGDEKLGFDVGRIERGKRKREKGKLFKNRQKEKKKRKLEDANESSLVKEHIPFGETVLAPPVLTVLKKGKQKQNAGMRNLLLKSSGFTKAGEKTNQDFKRKKELESERQRVVELYRAMKARKNIRTANSKVIKKTKGRI